MKPALFISATNQHEGKTTACLGILSGLLKRYQRVGFIKPVGQQHITLNNSLPVDKDVILFKQCFSLPGSYEEMSPIIFEKDFTKKSIDGLINTHDLEQKILKSYRSQEAHCDCMLVEGTGHLGVGSIAGINNARVASILGLEMVIVTSGGLGSAYDLLALSKTLCEKHGVRIAGVILNRVLDHKSEMIRDYMTRALKTWDIPLLGCIPYDRFLTMPTMRDFEGLFRTQLITGKTHQMRHFETNRLVATSVEAYEKLIIPSQLVITPSSREDIVHATLRAHWRYQEKYPSGDLRAGFIFTGSSPPSDEVIKAIDRADIPMLYSARSTFIAMKMITGFTAKIGVEDEKKVREAIDVMEHHIDLDQLTAIMKRNASS